MVLTKFFLHINPPLLIEILPMVKIFFGISFVNLYNISPIMNMGLLKKNIFTGKRENDVLLPSNNSDEIMKKYLHTPLYNREKETFINPFEDYWEQRYYTVLFNMHPTKENIKNICINYLEGLEWCIKYYTTGCPDWLLEI